MKYRSYFSSPPYTPRRHHRLLDNTPPSSPMTISSHPPSVNLNCSIHTTHRATIPRPASRNYKSQNASLPFLTPKVCFASQCFPPSCVTTAHRSPSPVNIKCKSGRHACLLPIFQTSVNQTIVTAHPVIEFLPM